MIVSSQGFRRTVSAAALIAVAAAMLPAAARAQAVTVQFGGRPVYLNPEPIERAGRVYVPLRAIFERLGSSVVYQNGTINATKGTTTVQLTIGSTQALVNGQTQMLDAPPFIVGASTYVPLRFVAQSFGANVGYNANTRVVAIQPAGGNGGGGGGYYPPPPPNPRPPPYPQPGPPVQLRAQRPAPGTNTPDRFTVISAEFTRQVRPASVAVRLDGNNITTRAGLSAWSFSYKPPAPLDYGSHSLRVTGVGADDVRFDRVWSFTVIRGLPPAMPLTLDQPDPNAPVGRNFVVSGSTLAYGRITVTVGATPSWTGQFSGKTTAGSRGNFKLNVILTSLMGQQAVTVRVTAADPDSGRTMVKTLQLRLRQ